MGYSASDVAERFQWTFPIVFDPHDPTSLYVTSQHVWRTQTEGQSWEKISPDLTRADASTIGPSGGQITSDQTGVESYATSFALAPSRLGRGGSWAGSDDSLVHVTRDGGAKLWVSAGQVFGTIGGGHLEYKAIDQARQMLQPGNSVRRDVQRYALGPGLGQCCGGVVWLAYEVLRHVDAVWCRQVAGRLRQGQPVCRVFDFSTHDAPVMLEPAGATLADFNTDRALWDDTSRCLRDTLAPAALTLSTIICFSTSIFFPV